MGEPVTIISPEMPPTRGGLADYTEQVIAHWPNADGAEAFVPQTKSREGLRTSLLATRGNVLVQYSAYGFDPIGYPRWLIDGLIDWKRENLGRLGVMFHEIWTFWPWWNKNAIVQQLHRRAIGRLLRAADAVFTTTESQAEYLQKIAPSVRVTVVPVGSNIVPQKIIDARTEVGTAIVFGMQGTRVRALRELSSELQQLAKSQRLKRIVSVGGGNLQALENEEREILSAFPLSGGFAQLGSLAAHEVSGLLAAAEFGIAAQDPLSYTKSGTFMAYAAHGLNILSPHARLAAPEPTSLLTSPAEVLAGLSEEELAGRARGLQAWHERSASWPKIAETFARAMQATT